jgi:hypothetical protein
MWGDVHRRKIGLRQARNLAHLQARAPLETHIQQKKSAAFKAKVLLWLMPQDRVENVMRETPALFGRWHSRLAKQCLLGVGRHTVYADAQASQRVQGIAHDFDPTRQGVVRSNMQFWLLVHVISIIFR